MARGPAAEDAREVDSTPARRQAPSARKKAVRAIAGLEVYSDAPRPAATPRDPFESLLHVVGTSSFARCAGFHVASCKACGESLSGTEEDLAIASAEHSCGPYDITPPEGWQDGAASEVKARQEKWLSSFLIRMKVKPPHLYDSPKHASFAAAINSLLVEGGGSGLTSERKMKFLVGTHILPGMKKSASQSKPMERYWPAFDTPPTYFEEGLRLDVDWYKSSVAGYVRSAFGFDSLEISPQRSLESWF